MAIIVDTDKYRFNHGKALRGFGLWLFGAEVPACRERGRISHERVTVAPQVTDHYRNAVAEAKRRLRRDHSLQDGRLIVLW